MLNIYRRIFLFCLSKHGRWTVEDCSFIDQTFLLFLFLIRSNHCSIITMITIIININSKYYLFHIEEENQIPPAYQIKPLLQRHTLYQLVNLATFIYSSNLDYIYVVGCVRLTESHHHQHLQLLHCHWRRTDAMNFQLFHPFFNNWEDLLYN